MSRIDANETPTFRFTVTVDSAPYGIFTECELPTIEWETDPVKEGGLNSYTHALLGRRKPATFTLKNGVGTGDLVSWYLDTMNATFATSGTGLRRTVSISLLDSMKNPVMTWNIENALPTKWSGPGLKSGENSVAIQTFQFSCGEITTVPGTG